MKKVILIDGNSLMYKGYFASAAMGNFMKNSKGLCTNAIYTFVSMMMTILKDKPEKILVAFDAGKQTFRHELFEDYKAGRKPMDPEMREQIPYIKKFLDLVGVKRYEQELYEADDIIGTMSRIAEEAGYDVKVYSSDKDLLQLISDKTTVYKSNRGVTDVEEFTPEYFKNKYQFEPIKMIDFKALMGDPSDNLKGIKGVGEKTATKLIVDYGSIEGIIEHKDGIKGKLGDLIRENYNDAIITKQMVTINRCSPIDLTLEDINIMPESNDLIDFYKELEFKSFLKKMEVKKPAEIKCLINEKRNAFVNKTSIYMEMLEENYHEGNIIGFGLTNEYGSFYFDVDILYDKDFRDFIEDETIEKYTFNYKKLKVSMMYYSLNPKGFKFDMLLASYIMNPKTTKNDFSETASAYNCDINADEQVYGKGAKLHLPEKEIYVSHIAKKSEAIFNLYPTLKEMLIDQSQYDLLANIEMPLSDVLADMEYTGIKVDLKELNKQKESISSRLVGLTNDIYDVAGEEFNISSTKQLGQILFEKFNLPCNKKTKTGYSTDSETLEGLVNMHELPGLILEYRKLAKLYSTYLEGIENVIKSDGKVHTIFLQAQTETGRLSSIEPNLQNIPIRSEDGAIIRKMFVPENDYLVSMDYSQIELRLLAHIANVKAMQEDFNSNRDIHEETAKAILHKDSVTKQERQNAKAINFGIIYGMSAWRLSNDIKVSPKEAQNFIDEYMNHYPEIKIFMDKTVNDAKEKGYVETLFKRRRYIPELSNPAFMVREAGKRNAMNAPIQGSAADIIKKAMVDIYSKLNSLGLKSKLVSQIHDELIFDVCEDEMNIILTIGKETMENTLSLSVPLLVGCGYGKTLYEAK